MKTALPADRLLSIVQMQDEIVASALDLEGVMALVARRCRTLIGAAATVVELAEGDETVYRAASGTAEPLVGRRLAIDSLSGLCVRWDEVLHCRDATADARVDLEACRRAGAMSMVCAPLRHAGRVVGVLMAYDPAPNAFDDADVGTLELLAGVIAAHMAHAAVAGPTRALVAPRRAAPAQVGVAYAG